MASALEGDEAYRRLRSTISKAVVAQSCAADLMQAGDCCTALSELLPSPRKRGTLTRSATEASLLQTAVMLYERATSAASKRGERGSVSIVAKLTVEQRGKHDAIVSARNRALAHVHAGEVVAGEVWHRELAFLVEFEGSWRPAVASHRLQIDQTMLRRLIEMIPVALDLIVARYHVHLNAVIAIMSEHPVPLEIFERCTFNPVEKFGSLDRARGVLSGQATGRVSLLA